MYLEVLKWPDSQEVMDKKEWFFIQGDGTEKDPFGSSAYARILNVDKRKEKLLIATAKVNEGLEILNELVGRG